MKIYLNATWFVVAGKGYKGMVEVCRPSLDPAQIHCEKIHKDLIDAQADAEELKIELLSMKEKL